MISVISLSQRSSGEFHNCFHMVSMREHVNRLDFLDCITSCSEEFKIPGKRIRPAGNIDNPFRTHSDQGSKELFITAGTRGIHKNNITGFLRLRHLFHISPGIFTDKPAVFSVIKPGIHNSIPYSIPVDFNPCYRRTRRGCNNTNRPGAAIGVQNRFFSCKPGKLNCCIIQYFRLNRVNLIK